MKKVLKVFLIWIFRIVFFIHILAYSMGCGTMNGKKGLYKSECEIMDRCILVVWVGAAVMVILQILINCEALKCEIKKSRYREELRRTLPLGEFLVFNQIFHTVIAVIFSITLSITYSMYS